MSPAVLDLIGGLCILVAAIGWDYCFRVWGKR